MKYIFFAGIFCFVLSHHLYSQSAEKQTVVSGDPLSRLEQDAGTVSIVMDPGIEDNYYKDLLYNQKNPGIKGYRIRIFTGSGVNAYAEAQKTTAHFMSLFENTGAYIEMDASDYKVYVGDCRTKSEVLKLLNRIRSAFPYSFVVSHDIQINTD